MVERISWFIICHKTTSKLLYFDCSLAENIIILLILQSLIIWELRCIALSFLNHSKKLNEKYVLLYLNDENSDTSKNVNIYNFVFKKKHELNYKVSIPIFIFLQFKVNVISLIATYSMLLHKAAFKQKYFIPALIDCFTIPICSRHKKCVQ